VRTGRSGLPGGARARIPLPLKRMHTSVTGYRVNLDDPRAPSQDEWDRLTPEQRKQVLDNLPSEFPISEAEPPEGDPHFNAKSGARAVLGSHFARIGRRVYLACELPVYYPGEKMFAPDLIAVLDVETHEREHWTVSAEGKGLDLAIEVHFRGRSKKDLTENVERYARLGITEYFVFDRRRLRLVGYRLADPEASQKKGKKQAYQPILPQGGMYSSRVLGLDLRVDGTKLRFYYSAAPLPEADELIASLQTMLDRIEERVLAAEERAEEAERQREEETRKREEETRKREEEMRKREEETRKREEETRKREEAERRLAEALAEIERLKRGGG
jgi:Uma2 family endonuclease